MNIQKITETELLETTISTERLLLVPVSMEFKEDVFREFNQEITQYMVPRPATDISETEAFITSAREKMKQHKDFVCFIVKKDTKEFFGTVGIHKIDTTTPELGCWIKKAAHGNKYGREAVKALKEWADLNIAYEYLRYPVAIANTASRKIPESLDGVVAREFQGKNGFGVEMPEVEYRIYKKI